jgi:hypothetical protein
MVRRMNERRLWPTIGGSTLRQKLRARSAQGQKFSGYVFGDNVTDRRAQLGINSTAFAWTIPSVERVVTNPPRTIGVELNCKF